ncbi:helix-turn-helix domain-containing protein [Bacillus safensis]|uniref:helix-turn-helix domain-containing protein n=1 Tax=Bacillus TaxID=1386 RepID=UPI0011A91C2E|nr:MULTISPECIES: helix-turn-helix transcriptional regulator [Bacillus]MCY7585476.1 helix-turn-helix domain-containing protein [Bacillus safensis]MCY7586911.1 helix-turn-helix domain-containing protein [Bacillus safensis]MCY7611004.1 helix-turn-helix domain-containing protein [Bacillus safensis]
MLGDRIRSLREKNNLTQEQMAKKIGISRGTYAHYEINKRRPDYETLIKIADLFNVSTDYLLKGEEHYKELASEINKRPDTRYAAIDGHDFEDEEKDEILVNALKQIDGLEKIIKEHLEKKNKG